MAKIPEAYLQPASQPWGRWVTSTLRNYLAKRQEYDLATENAIRQLNIATAQPMRAVLWRQTSTTVSIATAGTYVPINVAGTLAMDFNMIAGTTNASGLKNNIDRARTVSLAASFEGVGASGNVVGLKLALNGVPIDATESRSTTGGRSQWIQRMEPGDEVSLWVANIDATDDVVVARFNLLAHAVL